MQYGFPPTEHETWVEGRLSIEGGAVVFGEHCVVASSGASGFLVCEVLTGDRVLDTDVLEGQTVDKTALLAAECDVAHSPSRGVWATYERDRVVPRYLVRLAPRLPQLVVDKEVYAVMEAPHDAKTIRVVAGGTVSLQQAVNSAPEGATLVLEGVFRETVVLSGKNLRLVGGEGVKAVIHAPPDEQGMPRPTTVVRVTGPYKYCIEGITVQANKRRDSTDGVGKWAQPNKDWEDVNPDPRAFKKAQPKKKKPAAAAQAPLIDQGRCANCIEVSDCVKNCFIRNCVFQGGAEVSAGAVAYFKDCALTDGVVNGIYVCASKVLMDGCTVARHDSANVAVELSSAAYFLNCKIYGSKSTGVYLFNKGCAVFEKCDIFANEQTGIQMEGEGTDPTIRHNRIHHGEQYGMFVTNKATGIIEANHFYANVWAAMATTEGGNPHFRLNSVYRGFHYGLYSFDNGRGQMAHNFVHHNKDSGLAVASGASPDVTANDFYGGYSYGCYFFLKGLGRLESNKICSNHSANVCITYGSEPTVVRNRIFSGETDGVMVMQEGKGLVEENEIFNNYESNVMLQFDADPIIRRNKIYSGKKAGVCFLHKAKGLLVDNEIFGSEYSGVAIKTDSSPEVRKNYIHDNKRFAVLVQMRGLGLVTENKFANNTLGSVRVWSDSKPVITNNAFDAKEKNETRVETAAPLPPTAEVVAPKRPVPPVPENLEAAVKRAVVHIKRVPPRATTKVPGLVVPGEEYESAEEAKGL
jgi:nitrous oxidase accessory protein NosD